MVALSVSHAANGFPTPYLAATHMWTLHSCACSSPPFLCVWDTHPHSPLFLFSNPTNTNLGSITFPSFPHPPYCFSALLSTVTALASNSLSHLVSPCSFLFGWGPNSAIASEINRASNCLY
ncbi:hypothetical protein V6N12_017257 [Hibiscus sabdariffa]|uniref:Uncharacterized protein n=1 Tax=Hibiscus sabdariffa TaxID=183260 RepID=A0ABR2CGP8_9ROSI